MPSNAACGVPKDDRPRAPRGTPGAIVPRTTGCTPGACEAWWTTSANAARSSTGTKVSWTADGTWKAWPARTSVPWEAWIAIDAAKTRLTTESAGTWGSLFARRALGTSVPNLTVLTLSSLFAPRTPGTSVALRSDATHATLRTGATPGTTFTRLPIVA